jgi:hypothetical protein
MSTGLATTSKDIASRIARRDYILGRLHTINGIVKGIQWTRAILGNNDKERLLYDQIIVPKIQALIDKQYEEILNDAHVKGESGDSSNPRPEDIERGYIHSGHSENEERSGNNKIHGVAGT